MTDSEQTPTTVLVTGAGGQSGRAAVDLLGVQARAVGHRDLDISDGSSVRAAIERLRPSWVFNCAAATDVDRCELDHEYADRANHHGPRLLAEAAAKNNMGMVHVSTDFVFDGFKASPYAETDPANPVNYYGASKLRGEEAVLRANPDGLVVRTSWVYGVSGSGFPRRCSNGPLPNRPCVSPRTSPVALPSLATWPRLSSVSFTQEPEACSILPVRVARAGTSLPEVVQAAGLAVQVEPARASEFPCRPPAQSRAASTVRRLPRGA